MVAYGEFRAQIHSKFVSVLWRMVAEYVASVVELYGFQFLVLRILTIVLPSLAPSQNACFWILLAHVLGLS